MANSKMTNYFYTDTNEERQQINEQELRELVEQRLITADTPLETDGGHKGLAGQIPGLFVVAPSPFTQTGQTVQPPANLFCTNCGNSVSEQAVACMSCGARPTGHRKFCRHCGVAVNPEQVVCIKCGASLTGNTGISRFFGSGQNAGTTWQKNKLVAGLLGILLGGLGIHKFYMGSWGWGIVFLAFVVLTVFIGSLVTSIIGLVEGIMFLVMTEDAFAEKYPPETEAPFRW